MLEQVTQLSPASLSLEVIYLDPNNPRFAGDDSIRVSDEDIDQIVLQNDLISKMEREHAVDRLKDSMESNGYLPIDRIIVRQFKDEKFVVLEGNRRITAAKRLMELHTKKKIELDKKVVHSLKEIPVLIYPGSDQEAAWIFQGIRHISGIRDWSAYHKAKLLVAQMEEQELTLADAGKLFGISAFGAGQWVRGYYTYRQSRSHPDYQRDIDTRLFPILQELFGRSNIAIKDWLDWNEDDKRFKNADNFAEFLSWFYPKINDQGEFDPDIPGDWDNRRISRTLDLRLISDLKSKYPDQFQAFRTGTNLNLALARAQAKEEELLEDTEYYSKKLKDFIIEIEKLPIVQILNEGKKELIIEKIDTLSTLLTKIKPLFDDE